MFIKQIIIQGFKSYKDQTIIEPFSPGTNVVVGRNGSGKSNFFAAIRFVLSDAYSNLSREERAALLHEGSGSAVATAYVEIIFDNEDRRFQTIDKDDVAIRRTIGHKKDEYSVDKKVWAKKEVLQLLDTAGFSRSNPFYIVPQGRVTALTNMKEKERLNLLKEVAGTHLYEDKRAESLKIMNETNNKREKIDELLAYIKERLSELEEEKEELRGFQNSDRERRCLEYAYYYQQQTHFEEALEELGSAIKDGGENDTEQRVAFSKGEKTIAGMESNLSSLQQQQNLLKIDRRQLEEDRREVAKSRAKAELKVKNLADSQSSRDMAKHQHDTELDAVRKEIKAKETELRKLTPEFEKRKNAEIEVKQILDHAENRRMRLLNKQTRSSQFKNRAERDEYLQKEINDLNLTISKQKANLIDAEEEVKNVTVSIDGLERSVADLRGQLENWGGGRQSMIDQVAQAQETLDNLNEERKRLRREDEKLDTVLTKVREERDRAERELSYAMDHATAKGLATLRQLRREKDIPGAYGTLAELMEVPEAYRIAVEQTAGTSLFHYVVDSEKTASMLATELFKRHGGRITFMPLAQLKPRRVNMPRASDIVPLINKISYDQEYEDAFQQVFGKVVVTNNLQIGGQYARSHNVDAITSDGDIINKRGVISGGYIDTRKSRLEAVAAVNQWRDKYEEILSQSSETRRQIEQKDQEITRALGELQKTESQLRRADGGLDPLKIELRSKLSQLEREREHLDAAISRRDQVDKNMHDFGANLEAMEAELASDFKKALTSDEEQAVEELTQQVQQLQKEWNVAARARRELGTRKQILETDLRQNLRLKEDQLSGLAFENSTAADGGSSYSDAQKDLKKIQKSTVSIEKKIQQNEAQAEDLGSQISGVESAIEAKQQELQELARQIERHQKRIEKSAQKKHILTGQIEEMAKSIRDLGVLPDEAFTKYIKLKSNEITKRLKNVNEKLKKYKHVNKKAFEQYNSFTTQQEQLLKRREELDASQASIEELIAHLDERKDEAVQRTFKQVSKEFAEIFERLVPAGRGGLVIERKADKRRGDPEDSDEQDGGSVENYTGVGIKVSFNSKMDEQQKIQQLSGGQKSLCALCLIFALQRTESSPFVIFDEVDANLDAQYRTAVAELLQTLSKEAGTQFICTTFRPEIVNVADKCYGVTFRNKSSAIGCYDTEDALEFVDGQAPR
ncbi:Structural maintenance of chromosomes protein 3 [Diaporthe australafricana]|uniref:Structural maintenance of chromosomes protein n=1 Tax=Diaporthe australafricana TaxID=127596 RepID=A0ABR3XYX2_9PEZI